MSAGEPASAFAVLMSGARAKAAKAAAAKKKKALLQLQQQSKQLSPAKRKPSEDPEKVAEPKKKRAEDMIAEMKSKVLLLKKKPSEFDPKTVSCWEEGEKVPFAFLCLAFDLIANERVHIEISDIVCNVLRTVMDNSMEDMVSVVYLLVHKIAPSCERLELIIREGLLIKAFANAYGKAEKKVRLKYKEEGNLSSVAKQAAEKAKEAEERAKYKRKRASQPRTPKPDALTIARVVDTFRLIARESGEDSKERKKNHMKELFVAATDVEAQYLVRLLQSKLEIGLHKVTLLASLGPAFAYSEEHSKPPAHILSPLKEVFDSIAADIKSYFPETDAELLDCMECLDPKDSFSKFNADKLVRMAKLHPEEFSGTECLMLPQELQICIKTIKYDKRVNSIQDLETLAKKIVEVRLHTIFRLSFRLIGLAVLHLRMKVAFCRFANSM